MPGGEGQHRASDLRSLVTSDVLTVLRRSTSFVPPSLRIKTPGKDLQLFEVLSAYIMSLVESDFEWTVTPLQHDGGVDFYGEKQLFPIRGYEDFKVVIAGQCKASKTVRRPVTADLLTLLESIRPAIVYVFLMTPISRNRTDEAQRLFLSQTHRQCRILDLQSIVDLLSIHRHAVLSLFRQSLNASDERILRSFVEQLPAVPPAATEVDTRIPERILAGTPFSVRVNLRSLLLGGKPIHVHWHHPPDLTLIKPAALHAADGLRLDPTDPFSSHFALKLVTYHVGDVALGELVFESNGIAFTHASLGTVTTVDQYHPVFFWEPYHRQRTRFIELLEQAETNAPQGVAVIGQGGTGKTRFCQELGFFGEQREGEFISIAHPQDLSHPYRIFGLLMQELLADSLEPVNPLQGVAAYVKMLHPTLHRAAEGSMAAAFSSDGYDAGVFNREAMLRVLLAILLCKAKNSTYILHVSDLHWASLEALEVLGDLLQQLRNVAVEYRVAVLMVFEGRVQTNIGMTPDGDAATHRGSTVIFESFVSRYALEKLVVAPFTSSESRAFLAHLFENTQSSSRSITHELIPHQDVLVEEVRRYGQGNPFHMIEQIKLLRQEGTVARNTRTGLMYLAKLPVRSYRVPTSVHELISLRLQFIENILPELALLIKAVGFIKDRVDAGLFALLYRALASHTPAAAVHEVELLQVGGSAYVGFQHENYYQVVRDWPLSASARRSIVNVYLDWYRRLRRKSADVLYEEALVRCNSPRAGSQRINQLLAEALDKAERSHQYQLAIQVIETLLQVPARSRVASVSPSKELISSLRLKSKLARFSIEVRDWALGADQLVAILESIAEFLRNTPSPGIALRTTLSYMRAASLVELANTKTDLLRSHESVRHLTDARQICEAYFTFHATRRGNNDGRWRALYCRLLNRLGEAHWMDGNYAEALRCMEAATAALDAHIKNVSQGRLLSHINLLDYGAVLLHRSPKKAVRQLKKSVALVPAKGWHPHYGILASTTLVIGETVELFLRERGLSTHLRQFLQRRAVTQLQRDFEHAKFYGLKQEQVAASLMLGVTLSLLSDRTAVEWYMESIEIAFRSSNLESLWRGHLNLAQWLSVHGDREASLFHCQRATALLEADLRARQPEERRWRQRHLSHPLRRLTSLLPVSERAGLQEFIPAQAESGFQRSRQAFFKDKIIFLWEGENEYYPYGG